MRLQDGTDMSNGRVEICQNGVWGLVCNKMWDDADARVVCRQLGYDEGLPNLFMTENISTLTTFSGGRAASTFKPAVEMPVVLNEVECKGTEENLTSCRTSGLECSSQKSTGVFCGNNSRK